MTRPLFDLNGDLSFRDGVLQIIPTGGEASDCVCCDGEPPCPERKVCEDSEGNPIFPTKATSFYIDVTGIPDTMTAQVRSYFHNFSDGSPGCICDIEQEIERTFEYELNGFAALNRRYNVSATEYPLGGNSCDNVCKPCLWTIHSVRVPITGTLTGLIKFYNSNSCFPEEFVDTETPIEQELCATASISVVFNSSTGKYEASIVISGSGVAMAPPARSRISPTPPGITYIDLRRECFYPASPNSAIIGDFDTLAYNATIPYDCQDEEQQGDEMASAFSYLCIENAIDEDITKNTWPDCEYSDSSMQTTETGDPDLAGGCVVTTIFEAEFYRQGLVGFNARLVLS